MPPEGARFLHHARAIVAAVEDATRSPAVAFATSSVEAVRSMVAAGMGVTILSDMVYRPWSLEGQRIELHTLVDDIPIMDVGLA